MHCLHYFFNRSLFRNTPVAISYSKYSDTKLSRSPLNPAYIFLLLFISLAVLLTPTLLRAAQVTLAWDANDPAPEGYRLFQRAEGASYDYSQPAWAGSTTTCTIEDLVDDTQYYFVVRAYDAGSESGDSNEVSYYAPATDPGPVNSAPQAAAGTDQTVGAWTLVTLDGTGSSDPDGDTLNYAWVQTGGPTVEIFSGDTSRPTFTAPQSASTDTVLTFRLTVTDPGGLSASDTCRVTVPAFVDTNDPPVANAGTNQRVAAWTLVTLDGTGSSDPDGDALNYAWVQTGGSTVEIFNSTTVQPTFTAPESAATDTVLTFRLTVTDPDGLSASDTCRVTVPAQVIVNDPPVADAGDNQSVYSGANVTLNGSHSSDPEGGALTCQWVQTSGPSVQLSSATSTSTTFTAPLVETGQQVNLIFELTVYDNEMLSCTDTCIVQVLPAPSSDSDGDGIPDGQDAFPHDPSEWTDTDNDGTGNNSDTDDDNDAMPDAWEVEHGLDPLTSNAGQDSDGDGLTDLEEYQNGSDPMNGEENLPPSRPNIVSPGDGEEEVKLRLKVTASAFSDPNSGDKHQKSEWRITRASDQKTVLETTRYRSLSAMRVPYFVLNPGTSYTCQVRYYDQSGLASQWSPAVSFTTTNQTYWWSLRGILEGQEAPESTDLNANGVTDMAESETIKSIQAVDGDNTMAVSIGASQNIAQIDGAGAIDPYSEEDLPPVEDIGPYGMIGYRVQLQQPGQTAAVSLYFSDGVDDQTEWMALNSKGEYTDCTDKLTIASDGSVVRLLTDGGENDLDGTANGVVIEMLGPRAVSSQDDGDLSLDNGTEATNPSSGGGSCFIQTLMR